MDRYLFRGLRADGGGWVYGSYTKHPQYDNGEITQYYKTDFKDHYLTLKYAVIPETVGQWTGLRDKWEQMIFGGDKIVCKAGEGIIEFLLGSNVVRIDLGKQLHYSHIQEFRNNIEVIGNIHEEKQ